MLGVSARANPLFVVSCPVPLGEMVVTCRPGLFRLTLIGTVWLVVWVVVVVRLSTCRYIVRSLRVSPTCR